ncbi:hypothetical protein GCM10022261_14190 [Brevibacterium daeguense]|uniref:DUF5129 domain-containing protein n=1 Tax=Brevibacterium daeguense TaxID=909936 RepID=A0ABP8EIU2_9MICO|nr:DUF5129 domain-containing protein [Brevibacterium daeguense]
MSAYPPGPLAARVRTLNLITVVACLLVVALAILTAVLSRPDHQISRVDVVDEAQVLDPTLVEQEIAELRAYEPTRVLVYAKSGEAGDNLNEETLAFARDNPELDLISGDGQKWADGVFIVALSVESDGTDGGPGSGQVGTYFGEDIKIESLDAQQRIQSQGYDAFRARDWSRGVIEVTESAVSAMAKPFYASGVFLTVSTAVVVLLLLAHAGVVTGFARSYQRNRRRFGETTEGIHALMSETELIPDTGFGSRVKSTAHELLNDYTYLLDERQHIDERPLLALSAFNFPLLKKMQSFGSEVTDVSESSAMLATAVTLYSRQPGWQETWKAEIGQLRADVAEAASSQEIRHRLFDRRLGWELNDFCQRTLRRLDELEASGLTGDEAALDSGLSELTVLRRQLADLMNRVLAEATSHEPKRDAVPFIERAIRNHDDPHRRRRSLTGYYDPPHYMSPIAFSTGYGIGLQQHQQHQTQQSSSSSSTTGYGSSGGGFSGAGSSSSF